MEPNDQLQDERAFWPFPGFPILPFLEAQIAAFRSERASLPMYVVDHANERPEFRHFPELHTKFWCWSG